MRFSFFSITVILSGCVGNPLPRESPSNATLTIVSVDAPGWASFARLDGRPLQGVPATIAVSPGRHSVEYVCVVETDGQNTKLKMDFDAAKHHRILVPGRRRTQHRCRSLGENLVATLMCRSDRLAPFKSEIV